MGEWGCLWVVVPSGWHWFYLDVRKHTLALQCFLCLWGQIHPCPLWGGGCAVALSFWESVSCFELCLASQSHLISILFTVGSKGTCPQRSTFLPPPIWQAQDPTMWNCSPRSCRQKPEMLAFSRLFCECLETNPPTYAWLSHLVEYSIWLYMTHSSLLATCWSQEHQSTRQGELWFLGGKKKTSFQFLLAFEAILWRD